MEFTIEVLFHPAYVPPGNSQMMCFELESGLKATGRLTR